MDAPPLFSDGQVAVICSALVAAAGGIGGVIRWAVGRLVKAIDDGNQAARKAIDESSVESRYVRERLVELTGQVSEGRADLRDLRDRLDSVLRRRAAAAGGGPPSERRRRIVTDPSGFPARRHGLDDDDGGFLELEPEGP